MSIQHPLPVWILLAIALSWNANAAQPKAITIVSWGGAYEKSQTEAYFKPFTAKTGIAINIEQYDGGINEIRQQVQSESIIWDLVDLTMADNMQACAENLLETIDHATLPPAMDGTSAEEDFIEGTLTECGTPQVLFSTVLAYNTTAFPGEKPSTIRDLFDIEKFPGKRALQKKPIANLEWALMAYGVPPEDLYNLLSTDRGLRLAFAQLDKIKAHIVWWLDGSAPPRLLGEGQAVIASGYNGRLFNAAVAEGYPIEIIWDGQLYDLDTWGIPKGAPHKQTAMEFIRFATDTQRLADQAKYIAYGPARRSSRKLIWTHAETGVDMRPHMPTNPINFRTAIRKDQEWYAKTQDRMIEKFEAWLNE